MPQHLLFLTGKLAKPSLEKVLTELKPDFHYTVHDLGLSVAALMTTRLIIRRLKETYRADRIILPGRFRGNLIELNEHFGIPFERGPDELKDLPEFFGRQGKQHDLSRYDLKIFGEITEAPNMTPEQILKQAEAYAANGADVIDLGFLPDTPFEHLHDTIVLLKEHNFTVSIDTADANVLVQAGNWGADYLLSLDEQTLWVADTVPSTPVLIPNSPHDQSSLYRCIERLSEKQRPFIADPLLRPIHQGFTESIVFYHQLRHRYPDVEMLLGVGNVTELTHADTIGINTLLLGIASETGIRHILTTQVSAHCSSAIKEADAARRVLFAAREADTIPAGIDDRLMALHERKPFPYNDEEISRLARQIKDPGFRIQSSANGIHVYNRAIHKVVTDPFSVYLDLNVSEDGGHAFYLGVELARAQIAWQLGKQYNQDEELTWGCAVEKEAEDLTMLNEEGPTLKEKREKLKHAPGK